MVRMLVVREASGVERLVRLDGGITTLGRDAACTIRIDSPYVSRRHARIEVGESGPMLIDLGSHNGCLLNGVRVEGSAALQAGDVISIADATLRCLAEAALSATTNTLEARASGSDQLRVEAALHEVWLGDRPPARRLSAQEFSLLRYLFEHQERVCTRQELGDAIWGAHNWDTNMLHRLVHRLKDKVEPPASGDENPRYVQTVPQVGYRLTP
jgi:hypothetical protein